MSDLRVTDVQTALRHFQGLGHDVLTDSRAVHVDNQRYGLAVGHYLGLGANQGGETNNLLSSTIMQSERPLLSHIETGSSQTDYMKNSDLEHVYRVAHPKVPHFIFADRSTYAPNYTERFGIKDNYLETATHNIVGMSPLWAPDKDNTHPSIHESLQSHLTDAVSHQGFDVSGKTKRPLTPEDRFDQARALKEAARNLEPFKGLIKVYDHNTNTHYAYNPETEQLFKHEG